MPTTVEVVSQADYASHLRSSAGRTSGGQPAHPRPRDLGPRLRQVPRTRRGRRPRAARGAERHARQRRRADGALENGLETPDVEAYMPPVGRGWPEFQVQALIEYIRSNERLAPPGGKKVKADGCPHRDRPDVARRPRDELADDARPQAHRDSLHRHGVRLLLRRRRDGAAHARPARPGEQRLHHGELLQPALHRARDDDGLPLRRPHPRGLRQLPRPAHDRRARHGVPPPERPLVLALPPRRARHPLELPRGRGRRELRLDRLHAALDRGVQPGVGPGPLDPRAPPHVALVARGRDQLHRHDPQHAHAGDDLDAHPPLRLDDRGLRGAARARPADDLGGGHPSSSTARPGRPSSRATTGRSSGSTCSGSSATPRSTSWCCRRWGFSRRSSRSSRASRSSATRRSRSRRSESRSPACSSGRTTCSRWAWPIRSSGGS